VRGRGRLSGSAALEPDKQRKEYGTDKADQKTDQHLRETVLAKHHATGTKQTRKDEQAACGPDGIIIEDVAERDEQSDQATDADHVGRDFPPQVDEHRDELGSNGCEDNSTEKCGGVHLYEQHKAGHIAQERKHIGHVAMFTMGELPVRPAVQPSEHVDADERNQDGEGDDYA